MKICQPFICGKVIIQKNTKFNNFECECGFIHDWKTEGKVVQKKFEKPKNEPKKSKRSKDKKKEKK